MIITKPPQGIFDLCDGCHNLTLSTLARISVVLDVPLIFGAELEICIYETIRFAN